ncbi:magnesium chelatase subunit D [Loktanella sp. TSTF-M6]|uniref:Magnesium chelatase subunit D n=1 Tax=Loktanella gaetbuli TaxID=2881335 RepID=A0ABS8BT97_9RHOB|nr:magnesium chelatase subunit D [Loktanella gaetbuli]MCB5198969.1 magnesium chelatase subunit D [Loktanella gaetbuli]
MAEAWDHALLALRLVALDPALGGVHLRARSGPVRDALPLPDGVRLHPAIGDDALFGGLDLATTLATGHLQSQTGVLDRPGPLILTMAERCQPQLAARLAAHLDARPRALILLDEGTEDEAPPAALCERAAFRVDLSGVALSDITALPEGPEPTAHAALGPDIAAQITALAATYGIDSMRAPSLALRCARALARLDGMSTVTEEHVATACGLVFGHRATQVPQPPQEDDPPQAPQDDVPDTEDRQGTDLDIPDELLLEAVRAMIPDGLLDRLRATRATAGKGAGSGAKTRSNRRGRPLPSRPGRLDTAARIDVVATLRAAAPWQTIRRDETGRAGLHIRATDVHTRRFEEQTDRLLIFAVDASGSAALARLAEAKGAVELLLTQAYARRDHVALVSFRGTGAEILLPPTRSLVQTKRRLAALPGGGGTPLAAGLDSAGELAIQARRRGMTPTICLLTDGKANIARDGAGDRARAAADAQTAARMIRAQAIEALIIDTGQRPNPQLRVLAQTLDAPYLPLPRADSHRLARAVDAALPA